MLKSFIRDRSGATSVEYALIVTLIASVIILSVTQLGDDTEESYNNISEAVTNAG